MTGVLNLAGFDLDISTCLVLLVTSGVAFNYVTFFAVQYANSPFKSRNERTGHALFEAGPIIVTSYLSLLFASATLFLCTSGTMLKFAVMMILGLSISFITAFLFLPSLLHIMGPQDELGFVPQLSFRYFCANSRFCQMLVTRFQQV